MTWNFELEPESKWKTLAVDEEAYGGRNQWQYTYGGAEARE
jgi:hypothetical protein